MAEDSSRKKAKQKPRTSPNKVSDHLAKLAEPKKNLLVPQEEPSMKGIKKSVMKYKATKRIQNLAKPKYVNTRKIDRESADNLAQSITSVSPSALMYRPTKRILELAQPK